ncbi:hypothetical protein [Alkalihalobacillus sp. BA299]|uniref:hypothetical protein n=1 Tax=Alkalihalobacillus sp. BA299 TaxID=2815938 RepID=UPI001ADA749E|nr:hypothetical protein [Alkalihalobacillus sp. BA299]
MKKTYRIRYIRTSIRPRQYVAPIRRSTGLGGFSFGFFGGGSGYGYSYGYGSVIPVALAAIGGFALASAFFLW